LDAAYGAPTATVTYDASAPEGNFGSPTGSTDAISYSIYLINQGSTVYGFVDDTGGQGTAVGVFANLYFGINAGGSTLGFEITNQDAFTPGGPGPIPVSYQYATTANTVEFALPDSFFEGPLGTLASAGGNPGDLLVLRLSQSFGYSVAGGATYGPDRLGAVTLAGGVPELSTWAMMLIGFAGIGFMAYRRSSKAFAT
jgi:hypothetical protein